MALGKRDEDSLTTLAGRIARLDREISRDDAKKLKELSGGKSLSELANTLLRAIDPDAIAERATGKSGTPPAEVAPEAMEAARKQLADVACAPFDIPALRDALAKAKQDAYAVTAPDKVKGRSQVGRFADLVALVRFALEQQPVLAPFADSVAERVKQWLAAKTKAGAAFTPEQLAWFDLIRDHIATSLSIETDDFDYTPFSQRGGLGKAHQLFGVQLPRLLDELNEALAA